MRLLKLIHDISAVFPARIILSGAANALLCSNLFSSSPQLERMETFIVAVTESVMKHALPLTSAVLTATLVGYIRF
ncbi:MAG: hypothetical protein ACRDC4_16030, partial [Plesiomonas sp.]